MEDLTAEQNIRDVMNAILRRANTSIKDLGKLHLADIPPGYRRLCIELMALLDETEKLIAITLDETSSLE